MFRRHNEPGNAEKRIGTRREGVDFFIEIIDGEDNFRSLYKAGMMKVDYTYRF